MKIRPINNARLLAFEVLVEVNLNDAYSNLILPKYLSESKLSSADKAFAAELVYGSLRMKGRHEAFIKAASNRDLSEIDAKVQVVLQIGTHQLKEMRVPSHAAIYETVELAKRTVGKSGASFVNAVLRKIDTNVDLEAQSNKLQEMAQTYSHPEWIISAYIDLLKDEELVVDLLQSNNIPAKPTLIAWPGSSTKSELLDQGAVEMSGSNVAVQWDGNPGELSAIRERRAGVQDLGSQIVVEKFFSTYEPDLRWLDLCAGPGGKAAYLSALLAQKSGEFIANEISAERAKLVSQVIKLGTVTNFDGCQLPTDLGTFDRILLDAPCTGIGALRRRPEVRWRRTLSDLKALVQLQKKLLDSAAKRLNPSGIIGYATCSPHQAETIFQVREFLKNNKDFEIMKIEDQRSNLDGTLQLWTHKDGCDAMFLALLRRIG